MSSFEECVCSLFDDTGVLDELDAGREVFGAPVDEELRALSRLVDKVEDQRAPDVILRDPLMEQVRERAAAALVALDANE